MPCLARPRNRSGALYGEGVRILSTRASTWVAGHASAHPDGPRSRGSHVLDAYPQPVWAHRPHILGKAANAAGLVCTVSPAEPPPSIPG